MGAKVILSLSKGDFSLNMRQFLRGLNPKRRYYRAETKKGSPTYRTAHVAPNGAANVSKKTPAPSVKLETRFFHFNNALRPSATAVGSSRILIIPKITSMTVKSMKLGTTIFLERPL